MQSIQMENTLVLDKCVIQSISNLDGYPDDRLEPSLYCTQIFWIKLQGICSLAKAWVALMSRAWKGGSTSRWRKIREAVLKRDGCCQMCGQSEGQMHIDHVIPKRLGGGDEIWNLRQLCAKVQFEQRWSFF
jgi:hypothetical protein